MHIKSVDVIPLRIPFEDGSDRSPGLMPTKWTELDIALVRVETSDGQQERRLTGRWTPNRRGVWQAEGRLTGI